MDNKMHCKVESIFVDEGRASFRRARIQRFAAIATKIVFITLVISLCLALIFEAISVKQTYDEVLVEYNNVVQEIRSAYGTSAATLKPRAMETDNTSFTTYTTTTMTKGTTITVVITPSTTATSTSTSAIASASAITSIPIMSSVASGSGCANVVPMTVTVTVHDNAGAASSAVSSVSETVASLTTSSSTSVSTRITTTTVVVTADMSSSTELETATLTSTAIVEFTATATATAGMSLSSSFGSLSAPGFFPNSTSIEGLTVPPVGTATGPSMAFVTPATTTSRSDPISTVVTASGYRTAVAGMTMTLAGALLAMIACI